jgi:hypothetical protein
MSETTGTPAGSETPGSTDAPGQEPTGEQQPNTPAGEQTPAGDEGTNEDTDARVKRANGEAAKYRTELRDAQAKLEQATTAQQTMLDNIAKALGLKADEGADPATQVTELTGTVESLTTRNAQLEAELLVHTIAPEHDGNATALLDSRTFAAKLHGLDPAADDYRDQVAAAIKDAVETHPTLRNGQVPSAGGAEHAGQGAGGADTVTQEQFDAMSYKDRTALFQRDPALYRRLNGSV